jgi:4-hydroxy-tetrahydrodipicolinate reductase
MTRAGSNNKTVSIFVHGALGRMGRLVLDLAATTPGLSVVGGADLRAGDDEGRVGPPVDTGLPGELPGGTVVVDFSTRGAVGPLVEMLSGRGFPLVSGTTGLEESETHALRVYSENAPVFYDQNMSYGISVLKRMLATAGPLLRGIADVEILEIHHRGKRDYPSGTAYSIAYAIDPESSVVSGRESGEETSGPVIRVHSARVGGVAGDHRVVFASDEEMITVEHRALSRAVFARGALRAARFVASKTNGMFSMQDLLEAQNE